MQYGTMYDRTNAIVYFMRTKSRDRIANEMMMMTEKKKKKRNESTNMSGDNEGMRQ